jgi:hypothetical protein
MQFTNICFGASLKGSMVIVWCACTKMRQVVRDTGLLLQTARAGRGFGSFGIEAAHDHRRLRTATISQTASTAPAPKEERQPAAPSMLRALHWRARDLQRNESAAASWHHLAQFGGNGRGE